MGSAKAAVESLPGITDDLVINGLPSEAYRQLKAWHENGLTPMRRLITPEDVGNAVVYRASELGSFVTSQLLNVDGGSSIMNSQFPLAIQWPQAA